MSELPLVVGKIVRRLDKRIFSVARAAKRPYSITNRLCCKTEKAEEKTPHLKGQGHSSPFSHEVSEWDKKLLMWSGRFKKKEDIPHEISAKMMSASRSKLRVKVAYVAMAILLMGFVSAVFIGKQLRNRLTPIEISPLIHASREGMLRILSAKNFQQAGSRRLLCGLCSLEYHTPPPRMFRNTDICGICPLRR